MRATVDRHTYAQLSTAEVAEPDAFAYWREMICATFVRLTADPIDGRPFSGLIEHVPVGEIEMSTVVAAGQHVRRTRTLIADDTEEFLLASIQIGGRGRGEQDGRAAALSAGEMAYYDSTRPYALHFDDPFQQLVVQVPKRALMLQNTRKLTARSLGAGTPGTAVSAFFRSLAQSTRAGGTGGAILVPHALGLLSAAASYAGQRAPAAPAIEAMARQRVFDFLHRNLADPTLNADTVARACHVSRRTLYRIVGEAGVAAQLRRMRIERARALLLSAPERPVNAVAAACGFNSESGFFRAFRAETGQTPVAYRRGYGTVGQ
ncbi:AraC-like ligand-binding domain-containing protein [Saccharopolyspora elongata]|uniref:AraC-like ligand-binding domain-containing protein n=1 Tax=Saccharopolyspora elongata TaxID=2530387 RepID=UPI0014045EA2|nr:helix-turn-helix domain-containing protein [Saccharopolyspora elongata]